MNSNSTSKEIFGAFWGFDSNASIEIRPALYKRMIEDKLEQQKTKNSTNSPFDETNYSIWQKSQNGSIFMKEESI